MLRLPLSLRLLRMRLPLRLLWLAITRSPLLLGRLNLALPWLLLLLLLMFLNLGFLLILFFPLMPQLLPLLLRSRLITLNSPGSVMLPMSTVLPAPPVLLKSLRGDSLIVPPVPVPIVFAVVPSPARIYIEIKTGNIFIIRPPLVVMMGAIPTPFPWSPPPAVPEK